MSKKNKTTEFINKKATYEYFLTDRFEAGIQLQGTEIKSIRAGHVSLTDAYCTFDDPTNLVVRSLYIKEYEFGTYANHEPRRARKLLLKKQESRCNTRALFMLCYQQPVISIYLALKKCLAK